MPPRQPSRWFMRFVLGMRPEDILRTVALGHSLRRSKSLLAALPREVLQHHLAPIIWQIFADGHAELPPTWLQDLRHLVFFQGTTLVQGTIQPFLRVWQPRQGGECSAWAYKVWTGNKFGEKVRQTGLELTLSPSPGDAHIAGPAAAERGLTDGHHGAEIPVTVYGYQGEGPDVVRYEYAEGVYWEVYSRCSYAFALKSIAQVRCSHAHAYCLQVGTPMRRAQPIPQWHQIVNDEDPVVGDPFPATVLPEVSQDGIHPDAEGGSIEVNRSPSPCLLLDGEDLEDFTSCFLDEEDLEDLHRPLDGGNTGDSTGVSILEAHSCSEAIPNTHSNGGAWPRDPITSAEEEMAKEEDAFLGGAPPLLDLPPPCERE